jgi:hypothetical protein
MSEKDLKRQCLDKKRYDKSILAEKEAAEFSKLYKKKIRVYYCEFCTGYHLTSK